MHLANSAVLKLLEEEERQKQTGGKFITTIISIIHSIWFRAILQLIVFTIELFDSIERLNCAEMLRIFLGWLVISGIVIEERAKAKATFKPFR